MRLSKASRLETVTEDLNQTESLSAALADVHGVFLLG